MVLVTPTKKPIPIQHQRRVGQHHKVTRHYTKPYWPYLPLALLVVGTLFLNSLVFSRQGVLGATDNLTPSNLLTATNAERVSHQERVINLNGQLSEAAAAKAQDMTTRNYWSHTTPEGQTPWSFVGRAGYQYSSVGENLAYGFQNSESAVQAWMSSPEHRQNLLSDKFQDVGFGVASSNNYLGEGPATIVVALYGTPKTVSGSSGLSSLNGGSQVNYISNTNQSPQTIARLQLWTKSQPVLTSLIVLASVLMAVLFFIKHGLHWSRFRHKSERFMVRYHILDYIFVIIGLTGFVLTRTVGAIH